MSDIKNSVIDLIGNTPLLRARRFEELNKIDDTEILVKLEYLNPAGSAKDRVGLNMILDAEEKGILKPGATIIESTSGNTGIGLACVAASRGYRTIFVMPDTMSMERRMFLKAYGAEVVLTDGNLGTKGSVEMAEKLHKEINNSVILGQFVNPANPEAHYKTTGPEIWKQTDGNIDIFIASIGTGGTLTGTAKYLKEQNSNIKVIGVEPASSPLLTKGYAGAHRIEGIGANFIPVILDTDIYDEIIDIENDEAFSAGKQFARTEGILVGISSGAVLNAAVKVALREENKGKRIVILLPDSGDRYLSTELFRD